MNSEASILQTLHQHLGSNRVEPNMGLNVEPVPLKEDAANPSAGVMAWWQERLNRRATGWAQFSDANVWVQDGQFSVAPNQPQGLLLAAELQEAEGDVSHHLRHDGAKWIATRITRVATAGAFLEKRTYLRTEANSLLDYEVAWQPGPELALRPMAFRFIRSRHS